MTPRGADTPAAAAARICDQGTAPGAGGPGLGPERAIPRCARNFRIATAAVPPPRGEPGARFVVTCVVIEDQEALHAPMRRREPGQVAHAEGSAAWVWGMRPHSTTRAPSRRHSSGGRVQGGPAPVVEVEIHPSGQARAMAADRSGSAL